MTLDFFVSELQAALIIKHKEVHLEEKTTQEESPKEQRVEDVRLSPYELCQENEDGTDKNRRAEMQSEWKLVLDSLNLNSNSPITDVLSEVRFSYLYYTNYYATRTKKTYGCVKCRWSRG